MTAAPILPRVPVQVYWGNLSADWIFPGTTHTDAGTYAADEWVFIDSSGYYNNASGFIDDLIEFEDPGLRHQRLYRPV